MKEDVYNPKEADALDMLISERLGERQRKLEQMSEWERPKHILTIRRVTIALAVAAMVTIVLIVMPPWGTRDASTTDGMSIEVPMIDVGLYRAPMPALEEINQLIAAENYSEALVRVEQALTQSDSELEEMVEVLTAYDDEELAYYEELERTANGELRWTYICLLVHENKRERALTELKLYLKLPKRLCKHRDEAKTLKKRLGRK